MAADTRQKEAVIMGGDMRLTRNIVIAMRDGVSLRADLYQPCDGERHPTLLYRTVFRKSAMSRAYGAYDPVYFTAHGYNIVIQDVRGLGESDGDFSRFEADGKDGYDTVEWLAKQPFCDGNVGMLGNYYAGYLQLMAAAEAPPHLKAICPMNTSVSINRDCDNRGFMFYSHIGWCMSRQISMLRDGRCSDETAARCLPRLLELIAHYPDMLLKQPLTDMPVLKEMSFPLFKEYFRCLVEGYDDLSLIRREGRDMDMTRVSTPAFYLSSWYDSAHGSMLDHCLAQRSTGVDSRILIGDWRAGEIPARADSSLETGVNRYDIQAEMLGWFDEKLKGCEARAVPPIRYFEPTSGKAYEGDTWLPDGDGTLTLYLRGGRKLLESRADTDEPSDAYHHDPTKPLPFVPTSAGIRLDERPETVLYRSEPFTAATVIQGMVRARLTVSADTPDADVMLRLVDLGNDGSTFVICDGATRCRYRNSWTSEPLKREERYDIEVLMGHTRYTLKAGHYLLLEVCGSAFPKYDVNNGTGERPANDTRRVAANVSLYHDLRGVSRINLPIAGKRE